MGALPSEITKLKTSNFDFAKIAKIDLAARLFSVFKLFEDPSNINNPELIQKVTDKLRNKEHVFEQSTKLKLTITYNPYDIATIQTTTNEVPANTETMIDSIFYDEDVSTSTNQYYIIDVPDILESMDTQDPDPMSNTKEYQ